MKPDIKLLPKIFPGPQAGQDPRWVASKKIVYSGTQQTPKSDRPNWVRETNKSDRPGLSLFAPFY